MASRVTIGASILLREAGPPVPALWLRGSMIAQEKVIVIDVDGTLAGR